MHEISLVQGLFTQLEDLARQNNMTRVVSVTMQIGPLSGVVEDSFRFGFDILSKDNDLVRDATLHITTSQVTYRCIDCGHGVTTSDERPERCEKCGEDFLMAEGGDELMLETVEME